MIQLAIHEAINGRDLDYAIARATMEEMMDGTATDIEMATLLTALRMKGETITEITACAEVMREKGAHIEPKGAVMDIVGTGGDEVGSFNISTTAVGQRAENVEDRALAHALADRRDVLHGLVVALREQEADSGLREHLFVLFRREAEHDAKLSSPARSRAQSVKRSC